VIEINSVSSAPTGEFTNQGANMERVSRILVNVIGLLTLLGALGFMIAPAQMEPDFSILPTRLDGWGTLRADLGGPFLAIALFTFFGARPGKSQWLWVPVIFMATGGP
jgi:hypothetical protein